MRSPNRIGHFLHMLRFLQVCTPASMAWTRTNNTRLAENLATLAELLSKAGYQTASIAQNLFLRRITGLNKGFNTFIGDKDLVSTAIPKLNYVVEILKKVGPPVRRSIKSILQIKSRVSESMVNIAQDWIRNSQNISGPFYYL